MRSIASADKFKLLGEEGLDLILDPTVLLVAEKFVGGASSVDRPDHMWPAISGNLGCLAEFIDAMILHDTIPVFDFWMTRLAKPTADDEAQALGALVVCNELRVDTFQPIGVETKAWSDIATDVVLKQLAKIRPLPTSLVTRMRKRLTAVGWRYEQRRMGSDDLTRARSAGDVSGCGDLLVNGYIYCGLLFSEYNQRIGARHVIPGGWSEFHATTLIEAVDGHDSLTEADPDSTNREAVLFEELARRWNAPISEKLPRAIVFDSPTFLPYLLRPQRSAFGGRASRPTNVRELLERTFTFREQAPVKQYRRWHATAMDDVKRGDWRRIREVKELSLRLGAELGHEVSPPSKTQVTITLGPVSVPVSPIALWGFISRELGPHRYQKMLVEVGAAIKEQDVGDGVREIWRHS